MLSAKYRQLVVILKISKYGPPSHFLPATAPHSSAHDLLKQTLGRGNEIVLQYGVTTSHHPQPH